MQFADMSFTCT